MDFAADRFHEGMLPLQIVKNNVRQPTTGLPSNLDEAALLLCALSFGPLSKTDLARALKQVGMTMPDGSPITVQKAGDCMQRLAKKGRVNPWGQQVCTPEMRVACIDAARSKGWLLRFAEALQQALESPNGGFDAEDTDPLFGEEAEFVDQGMDEEDPAVEDEALAFGGRQ